MQWLDNIILNPINSLLLENIFVCRQLACFILDSRVLNCIYNKLSRWWDKIYSIRFLSFYRQTLKFIFSLLVQSSNDVLIQDWLQANGTILPIIKCPTASPKNLRTKWLSAMKAFLSLPHTPCEVKDAICNNLQLWLDP